MKKTILFSVLICALCTSVKAGEPEKNPSEPVPNIGAQIKTTGAVLRNLSNISEIVLRIKQPAAPLQVVKFSAKRLLSCGYERKQVECMVWSGGMFGRCTGWKYKCTYTGYVTNYMGSYWVENQQVPGSQCEQNGITIGSMDTWQSTLTVDARIRTGKPVQ